MFVLREQLLHETFIKDNFCLVYLYHYFFLLQLKSDRPCIKNICYVSHAPVTFPISSPSRQNIIFWIETFKIFYNAFATDFWDTSCFLLVVKMLLPIGKTMYFFEICWFNSCREALTVHQFPFFLTGMLASTRWFPINTK